MSETGWRCIRCAKLFPDEDEAEGHAADHDLVDLDGVTVEPADLIREVPVRPPDRSDQLTLGEL